MKLINCFRRIALLLVIPFLLSACGGGGSGGGNADTLQAPYLISSPRVSSTPNGFDSSKHDVTVTLEADGPSGIFSVSVWLIDVNDSGNIYHLDLFPGGVSTWTATTDTFLPLKAGTYKVESIELYDADPFLETSYLFGWYFEMPLLSSSHYYVDQRDIFSSPAFNIIASGLSSIPIKNFTLP